MPKLAAHVHCGRELFLSLDAVNFVSSPFDDQQVFSELLFHNTSNTFTNMHTSEYDYLFKLLLIGDSGVGKVLSCVNTLQRLSLMPQPFSFVVLLTFAVCGRHIHRELY